MTDFTLLLPVWAGNRPDQLRQAFESSVHDQTRRPDEVLVVVDGPAPEGIDRELAGLVASSPVPTAILRMPVQGGLAVALNAGLARVTTEYVARMDADDASHPERFSRQLAAVEARDLDILGTGIAEFVRTPETVVVLRTPPVGEAIRRRAPWAQPFNHPTVVFRREAVLAAGGYPTDVGRIEDYVLFARMLVAGARADNLPEPLLSYRVDDGAYHRRGGWRMFRDELRLQHELRRSGLTTAAQQVRNVALRGTYRLTPTPIRMGVYRASARRRARRSASTVQGASNPDTYPGPS